MDLLKALQAIENAISPELADRFFNNASYRLEAFLILEGQKMSASIVFSIL